MNAKVIVIDGKTYHSVDEMSPEVRQKYERAMSALGDANGNHIPDAFESMNVFADKDKNGVPDLVEDIVTGEAVVKSMKIIIDGKEFNGIEDLPPEARLRYEKALGKLDANQNGIPDFAERIMNTQSATASASTSFSTETSPRSAPIAASPTITPDTSNGWMLVLLGLFLFLLCVAGAAGVWYLFLRG